MKNNYKLIALFVLLAAFGCKENTKATVAEEHHEENENVVELSNEQLAQTEIKGRKTSNWERNFGKWND